MYQKGSVYEIFMWLMSNLFEKVYVILFLYHSI